MKKIPTLFKRVYKDHKVIGITPELTDSALQVVLDGLAIPTLKVDGSCCAIFKGELYKRYDAKKGKKPPVGATSGMNGRWKGCKYEELRFRIYFRNSISYIEIMWSYRMVVDMGIIAFLVHDFNRYYNFNYIL